MKPPKLKQVTDTDLVEKYGFTMEELYGPPEYEFDERGRAIEINNQSLL